MCALKIGDVDVKTGKVQIKHGVLGGAKGGKGRTVYLGKAVWRYVGQACGLKEQAHPFGYGNVSISAGQLNG